MNGFVGSITEIATNSPLDCFTRFDFHNQGYGSSLQEVEVIVGFAHYDDKKTVFRIEPCGTADDGNDLLWQEGNSGKFDRTG